MQQDCLLGLVRALPTTRLQIGGQARRLPKSVSRALDAPSAAAERTHAILTTPGRVCSPGAVMVRPAIRSARRPSRFAPLAQSAERLHGKEKVYGSIP